MLNDTDYLKIVYNRIKDIKNNNKKFKEAVNLVQNALLKEDNIPECLNYILQNNDIDNYDINYIILFLKELIKAVSTKKYNYIIGNLLKINADNQLIDDLKDLRAKKDGYEIKVYFYLNFSALFSALIFYLVGLNTTDIIPIITEIHVIISSFLLKPLKAVKLGVVFALINLLFNQPIRDLVTYDYKLIFFFIIEYLTIGIITAIIPNLIYKYIIKFNIKYQLYIAIFITALLFISLITLGDIYYLDYINKKYDFDFLIFILKPILVTAFCSQLLELVDKQYKS